ncbi:MAG: hypothetical protein E6Q36_06915 [Chryseobacterium sp.]|nr:MAG: hypothetical protein E6Q36_06915 [Chryseobacterium sp.]
MKSDVKHNYFESNKESQRISLIISACVAIAILVTAYFFTWTEVRDTKQTRIVVNFVEEPKPEIPEELQKLQPEVKNARSSESSSSSEASGSNKNTKANSNQNTSTSPKSPIRSNDVSKDGKHVSAAENNAKVKGTTNQEKGKDINKLNQILNKNTTGGNGDKTNKRGTGSRDGVGEGNGTGDGKIGEGGRSLISKIPGTMGEGGSVPEHSCDARGRVWFKFYVDKSGKVTKVEFIKGKSDGCLVSTGQQWIKRYVKANSGNGTAYGTYDIQF